MSNQTLPDSSPKRKALLIGIQYEGMDSLHGPHKDVEVLRKALLDDHGYTDSDIRVMLDSVGGGGGGAMEPTRENMLREVEYLVKDAQPGDHFLFHYAGHSTQSLPRVANEEERWDDIIMPSDYDSIGGIYDDDLRRLLVDPLPVGSSLVAIVDSCHSASMLDLKHHRCNRVWTPWNSKGKRRTLMKWNANVRQLDILASPITPFFETELRSGSPTSSVEDSPKIRQTSISVVDQETFYSCPSMPIAITGSPVCGCSGFCRDDGIETPFVVCLSACKDSQTDWECDGSSMTLFLINTLKKDPHPTLRKLMTAVSHDIHQMFLRIHDIARDMHRNRTEYLAQGFSPDDIEEADMNNFQDPQLSSHNPLDLDKIFTL